MSKKKNKSNHYIYVVDRHGNPVMPSRRPGRIRHLLKEGKAVPISTHPFVVKLKYDIPGRTQPIHLGIDTGRENIGVGASLENGENVFLSDVETKNKAVTKAMSDRRAYRMSRRRHRREKKQRHAHAKKSEMKNGRPAVKGERHTHKTVGRDIQYPGCKNPVTHKVIKGKEARIANRRRDEGWQTPSARQLIQTHMCIVRSVMKFLPVTHITIEMVSFDFQKLANVEIKDWEYSDGPLHGFKSPADYVWARQNGKCYFCDKKIAICHHAMHRAKGGSDRVGNLVGLCPECHQKLHGDRDMDKRLQEEFGTPKISISVLNSAMPEIDRQMRALCDARGIVYDTCTGFDTYEARKRYGIPKDHCTDGYVISLYGRNANNVCLTDSVCMMRRFRKKSGSIIQKLNQRIYKLKGKVVAVNRHKRTDQKEPALDDYMSEYAQTHSEAECRRHFHELEIIPARRTYTYRKQKLVSLVHIGDTVRYEKCNKTSGITKKAVFVAEEISMSHGKVKYADQSGRYGKKSPLMKYCRPIRAGSLKFIRTVKLADCLFAARKEAEARRKKQFKKPKTLAID